MKMPLFVLRYKDKTLYAFSEEERDMLLKKNGKPKEISRKKALVRIRLKKQKKVFLAPSAGGNVSKLKTLKDIQK